MSVHLCCLFQDGYGLETGFECAECKGSAAQVSACIAFFLCMGAAVTVLSRNRIKKAESSEYSARDNVRVKMVILAVAYFQAVALLQGTDLVFKRTSI